MCRSTCRATEVIGLQFELMQPSPNDGETEQECSVELQTRLSMARERVNTLVRADAERCREVNELQGRVMSLERELCSHREKATEAEAKASEFRARLVRAHVLRERLSTELQQLKQELLLHDTKKK
ncbi:hypothetical protein, conserved [Eimeria necatrix]|uniref:Uncharacterized protein n=1 Tax=Eimeria necatrix TaxID=51315 RepID=U6MNS9_9EIME|nr:hypothetical protein, conserved [Eimeria necatrix]CDJ65882.1 hypothetical protein, conserved [Eimeria necatrix]